ncbi:MAG: class I SAM-dependent methyltransferase [Aquabacterium sp.]|jgi:SAM-dependent methyltransferase|nr:MAG: class I SAM-dependent methyltransferase [Aquabacterium sp.]TAL21343.1 MAG: class I SAM-dependent methyltransferase [Aquabacterium sp.]
MNASTSAFAASLAAPTGGMPLDQRLSTLGLVCPKCRGRLLALPQQYRCTGCESVFSLTGGFPDLIVGERFDDPTDETLLTYEENSNADLTANYWTPLFKKLWPKARKEPRLLSVGCGTGVDVEMLHKEGFDSVGIDCGNRTAVWPRRAHYERLLLANGKHLPFDDNSFDAAFCGCVFPHVGVVGDSNQTAPDVDDQRYAMAREMVRILRPGGYVVVASPNRWFPMDIFHGRTPGSYKPRFNSPASRFLMSVGDYERVFARAGTGPATPLPVENYWGFIRSQNSIKGTLFGAPVRFVFWLVSRPGMGWLRGSPINPWIVVMLQKQ